MWDVWGSADSGSGSGSWGRSHWQGQVWAKNARWEGEGGKRDGWGSASTIGGPSKGGHVLPVDERLYVIREMVKRWNPHVKISPVAPLSWPGEVVDGALWLLTRVPRKTTLRNLGGEPDKVIETLLDASEN